VAGLPDRSNNGAENFHKQLKMRVKVSHPNLFVFLDHHLRSLSVTKCWTFQDSDSIRDFEDFQGAVKGTTAIKRTREGMEKYSSVRY
jgi:hypothetical protein